MNSYPKFVLAALCLSLFGCEGNVTPTEPVAGSPTASNAPPAPLPGAPGVAPEAGAGEEPAAEAPAEAAAEAEAPAEEPAEPAAEEAPAAEEGPTEKAQVGVGKKGKDYGGEGIVTTPIQAYFRTGDRIAFEIQIPNAMKLYKAEHNNKGPKTHDEFWKVIIVENAIELPELPEGDSFAYDPKAEQLMVRHPAGKKPE